MWNLLLELRRADQETQNCFERLQAQYGRLRAVVALMSIGARLGGTAMFWPYAMVAFILSFQIRGQDPILGMLFLILYVVLGTAQGIWLGTACGAAAAFRAQRRRQEAGVICWLGSLPYLLLLIWFGFHPAEAANSALIVLFLCGLPLLWAVLLLFLGTRLLTPFSDA